MKRLKKVGGVILIIIGFIALITPLTPGAFLFFVGLELLGIRLAAWDNIKKRFGFGPKESDTPPPPTPSLENK
jgi:uncharacterized protein YqgC (DUF456 family)